MAAPLLFDFSSIDLSTTCINRAGIYKILPHAHEFRLLGGVCMIDASRRQIVAYADITEGDWWVRAHVPGRAILPGVLILEMAAQTSAVLAKTVQPGDEFIAFGGIKDCKFRQSVAPGVRLYLLGSGREIRNRRIVCLTQGVVDGRLVFEAEITGMIFS